jgi:pimeloyl-ACP methyl ester carboxylesterase
MSHHTHQTAPTQFLEADGIRFAYRRFGKAAGIPLVFNQHYLGTMDHWDPTVTDGLARDRDVILFNNVWLAVQFSRTSFILDYTDLVTRE